MERGLPLLQRVPPEILLEIFLECHFSRPIHTLSIRQAPLNVSQTCRYWRDVALSSSLLWAHLDFHSRRSRFQHDHLRYILTTMDTWFLRSNKAPLSFNMHISIPSIGDKALRSSAEKVVSSLFRQQNRWKVIKLICMGLDLVKSLYLEATSMPLIESLQLRFSPQTEYYYPPPHFDGILDLTSSLRLKTLHYRGSVLLNPSGPSLMALTECAFTFRPPITEFLFMDVCLNLLQLAPNLESFSTHFGETEYFPPVPPGPMLMLPRLRTLSLMESVAPSLLIQKLTLPGLVDLEINSIHDQAGGILVDFMRRSQPRLESLIIIEGCPEEDELLDVLHPLLALRSLTIETAVLSYYFLIGMTLGGPWGVPCPTLQSIVFCDIGGWEGDEGLVADMLVSRWHAPRRLEEASFLLVECDMEEIMEMQPVRRCVEEGLQLRVQLTDE
ncbi:hypothetical protein DFH11DRAFT_1565702 [Phellopilus nigrolimitatus]|nr:hypothetical protein DFH11DRAFT_1565702 [Phellopilus nigrolimitatus]